MKLTKIKDRRKYLKEILDRKEISDEEHEVILSYYEEYASQANTSTNKHYEKKEIVRFAIGSITKYKSPCFLLHSNDGRKNPISYKVLAGAGMNTKLDKRDLEKVRKNIEM